MIGLKLNAALLVMSVVVAAPALAQDAEPQDAEIEDRVPLVRIPFIPAKIFMRGLAADCVAEFDVRPDGSTANTCVVCTSEVFANEAASSVKERVDSWRYTPVDADAPNANVRESVEFEFRFEGGQDDVPADNETFSINCNSDT